MKFRIGKKSGVFLLVGLFSVLMLGGCPWAWDHDHQGERHHREHRDYGDDHRRGDHYNQYDRD